MSSTALNLPSYTADQGVRRCATSLGFAYGDSPATRRIVNDAERSSTTSTGSTSTLKNWIGAAGPPHQTGEKIPIPDTPYDSDFWGDEDDGGRVGGRRIGIPPHRK